jgi:hypothetical protein
MIRYTSITRSTFERGRKRGSTYMFFEGNATSMTPFNFLKVPLKLHTLFLYDSPSMFKGIDISFRTEDLVVIIMIADPSPVGFAWLVIPNYRVIEYIHPRHTQLDVLVIVVVVVRL